ncbi:MAG: hypothetical protein RIB45_03840 [Marivibrio sp.]|uniref:hypothetical protein n=1 Tax=Marivibrio sp. TaxID=2039719 RepID=UPI0032EDADDD
MTTDMMETRSPWIDGGRWLTGLRRDQMLTPAELAEQVGAPSARWIEEVEAGRRPIPSSLYLSFARQFAMSAPDFAALCLKFYDPKAHEALFGPATPALAEVRAAA